METCDVCKIEFTSAEPNEAVADAKIKQIGVWGFVCNGHLDYGVPGTVTYLDDLQDALDGDEPHEDWYAEDLYA